MPDLKSLQSKASRARKKPAALVPKEEDKMTKALVRMDESNRQRDEAMIEALERLTNHEVSVELDAKAVGDAVGREIKKMKPPVLQVPERKPQTYHATIERNSRGQMTGALIEPVVK